MNKILVGNLEMISLLTELLDDPGAFRRCRPVDKEFIVIHHSASPGTTTPEAIYNEHKRLGWGGIGYSFLVKPDGTPLYVGEINSVRAGVGQISYGNLKGIHVCMLGNFSQGLPPEAQLAGTKRLIAEIQQWFGWWLPIAPHCQFNTDGTRGQWNTECPGITWRIWWPKLLRAVGD